VKAMKKILLILIFFVTTPASALEMGDISTGSEVCEDGFFNSNAIVIKKDYNDNTVRIRLLRNNEEKWIKISDLVGKDYCQFENKVQESFFKGLIEGLQK
jgi:hypothetical protein